MNVLIVLSIKYTWTCLNIPGLYSSKYFTCHTRKVPSTGCIVKSMSGFLFHSVSSISIFRSSRTVGSGIGALGREQVLGLPSRSASSCSDDPVPASDSLSRDNSESENKCSNTNLSVHTNNTIKIHLQTRL